MHEFGLAFTNIEAEASAVVGGGFAMYAIKALINMLQVFLADALAVVGDGDAHSTTGRFDRDVNVAVLCGVFDSVSDEVHDDFSIDEVVETTENMVKI